MIELINVTKKFKDVTAVNNVNIKFNQGEIIGLLGRNGSGKSTIFRMILSLLSQDDGEVLFDGKPYTRDLVNQIGYLPEERSLYLQQKVLDQIVYFAKLKGLETSVATDRALYYLDKYELLEYRKKKVKTLSKGNQQKVAFIIAIIHKPKILILDEPLTGFDPVNAEIIKQEIIDLRDEGRTIIFSSHQLNNVEDLCSSVVIINKGVIISDGTIKEIRRSFGKNNVIVEAEGLDLENISSIEGVEQITQNQAGTITITTDGKEITIKNIFENLKSASLVTRFELDEPSLHQIFVEKVGDVIE